MNNVVGRIVVGKICSETHAVREDVTRYDGDQ
jgi:hypothetical protein